MSCGPCTGVGHTRGELHRVLVAIDARRQVGGELGGAMTGREAPVVDDGGRFVHPLMVEMVNGVLEHGRVAASGAISPWAGITGASNKGRARSRKSTSWKDASVRAASRSISQLTTWSPLRPCRVFP